MVTTKQAVESEIKTIQSILNQHLYEEKSYWDARMKSARYHMAIYESAESKERPVVDYGSWVIVFADDKEMMSFFEQEAEDADIETTLDDILETVHIEYMPMTGIELGELEHFEE